MGLLVEGQWHDQWYDTKASGGKFVRSESQFRHTLVATAPAEGEDGVDYFLAEPNRYHLYVSLACPWAHRTLIVRALKGLESLISVSVVHPVMKENGWTFETDFEAATGDSLLGKTFLHQIYTATQSDYSGRVTVPVLWDKKHNCIVNNESSEIIRMLNTAFDDLGAKQGHFYPSELRDQIDEVNEWIYPMINNGVYRAGFATSQDAYNEAVAEVFEGLDRVEAILASQRYLVGDVFTEADIRLFTTLVRFDPVYVSHFKCDLHRIADYPNTREYLREIYQMTGVADTVDLDHIRTHYFVSHDMINPTGVIPLGPVFDLNQPHQRGK